MDYIRHTKALDELYHNLDKMIEANLFEEKYVVMFGCNKIAGMIIYYLQQKNIKVDSIIDNNKNNCGQIFMDVLVSAPQEVLGTFRKDVLVLIASGFQAEMIKQLEDMGYKNNEHIRKVIDLPMLMNDYSFVQRDNFEELNREEIRNSQLRCLKKVKSICENNNIRYFLCGGTLLGAVRHQGYIPWDDDIDIFIVLKDWEKFSKLVRENDEFGFINFLGEDDYYDDMGLFYDKSNICDANHFPMQTTAGISIDVMPLIGLPDTQEAIKEYAMELKNQNSKVQNTLYDLSKCKNERKKLYELMLKYDYDTSKNIGHILGPYFMKEVRPKEWFEKTVYLKFEDEEYAAPIGYDNYLRKLYGDYMQLPPEDKRIGHHYFRAYKKKEGL